MITVVFTERHENEAVSVSLCNGEMEITTRGGDTFIKIDTIVQELSALHDVIEKLKVFKQYRRRFEK